VVFRVAPDAERKVRRIAGGCSVIAGQFARPENFRDPVIDVLHGVSVEDPYRWLEDQNSIKTRRWIEEQSACTRQYFDRLSARTRIRKRIADLLTVETYNYPIEIAGNLFFSCRKANQEQPCIILRTATGEERVLIDPSSRGATVSAQILTVSSDARLLVYSIKHGGEDTECTEILDVETGTVLNERFLRGRLHGFWFIPDGSGFLCSHRSVEGDPTAPFSVRCHRFGTSFEDDTVLFSLPYSPEISGITTIPLAGTQLMFLGVACGIYLQTHKSLVRPLLRVKLSGSSVWDLFANPDLPMAGFLQ